MPKEWKFISYLELSKSIRASVQKSGSFTQIEKQVIYEYCEMIENIHCTIIKHLNCDQRKEIYNFDNIDDLQEIRFDDVYKKLKANEFVEYFNKKYKNEIDELLPNDFAFMPNVSFNRSKATIDMQIIKVIRKDNKIEENIDNKLKLTIQLEGDQYRFGVHKNYRYELDEIFKEFSMNNWLDEMFSKNNRTVKGYKTNMKPTKNKLYNKYSSKNGDYNFVYQHYNIDDSVQSFMTYKELSKRIYKDLKNAIEIINSSYKN